MTNIDRYKLVTEIDIENEFKHSRYIRFPVDGSKEFDYKARGSFDAFFHSMKQRNYAPSVKNPKLIYHVQSWEEKVISSNILKNLFEETGLDLLGTTPLIECDDLWEFYSLIGYDRKTKKFAL